MNKDNVSGGMRSEMRPADLYQGRRLRMSALRTAARFYIGVDLGQAQDHTAIAVIERAEVISSERDPLTWSFRTNTLFHVRHAQRIPLGSPYPEVVEHVQRLASREPLKGHVQVIVDATGVGAPVVDLLRRGGLGCPVVPVLITSGDIESSDGVRYRVPKRDLLAGLQVAFQKRRLGLSAEMPAVPLIVEELRGMRVRMSEDGHERISGRRHDDLVLALSLAWWRARREAGWGC